MNLDQKNIPANILVVDDTADSLRLLGGFLKQYGYEVRLARDGNLAIKSALEEPPDLILLDIVMPEPDGYEVLAHLKANERTCQIPVIFISAKGEVFDKIKAFSLGGVDYITKPFELEEVVARVENQLKIWKLSQELANQNKLLQEEITERRRVEIQLTNSKNLNRSILNSAPVGICLTDADGYFVDVNPAYCKLYGFEPSDLIGKPFTLHFPYLNSAEIAVLVQQYQEFISNPESYHQGEFIVYHQDGTELIVDITRGVFQRDDGEFFVVTTIKDISDRKRAEEEMRLLLQASEAINEAIDVDTALGAILELFCTRLGWDLAEAWLPTKEGTVLQSRQGWYKRDRSLEKFCTCSEKFTFALGEGLPGRVWLTGQAEWIEDIGQANSPIFLREKLAAEVGLKAAFGIPIITNKGVLAVLVFFKIGSSPTDQRLTDLANAVAAQLGRLIESKQAQQALLLSEERLQLALEGSDLGLWDWYVETGDCYFSPQWKKMLGYAENEINNTYETWQKLVHPEDLPAAQQALNPCLTGASSIYKTEFRMLSKSGEWRWILVHGKIFERDSNDQPLRMAGTHKDISDRKQAEIALEQQLKRERLVNFIQERIRSSLNLEDILRTAVEEVRQFLATDRVFIYRIYSNGTGSTVTESVEKSCQPILGKTFPEEAFPQEFLHYYTQGQIFYVEDVTQGEIAPFLSDFSHRFGVKAKLVVPILKDEHLWGLLIAHHCRSIRRWEISEIESIRQISIQLAIAIQQSILFEQAQAEILERKKAESALQKAAKVADAANRAKSEFLANMSHELRTPLNAILGFTQVMSGDSTLKSQHHQQLEIINRAGAHLLELINDILEMSKIEAGRVSLNKTNFDLFFLLKNLTEMLSLKATQKDINLNYEIASDVPRYVRSDEGKLRQILLNILGNALKFTEQGCVSLRVTKKEKIENDCQTNYKLHFAIEDTGPGIAPDEMDKLFEAFGQTQTGRKSQEGTGLGLPISQKFVELMGGNIQVHSVVDQGSTFEFEIVVQLIDAHCVKAIAPTQQIIALAPNQPKYRILAADDRLESRLLLNQILTNVGFEVKVAENGLEAVHLWRSWQPHIILIDMRMPVMNGLEATQQIKSELMGQSVIIIALTANAFEEDRSVAFLAGCHDFIPKPLQKEMLLETIGKHLNIQYLYEEKSIHFQQKTQAKTENLEPEALQNYLAQMPTKWVEKLYQLAAQCTDEQIFQLLKEIPPENAPLATVLGKLAHEFEFEKIMKLIENGKVMN